jgi:type IX secretion system PorP/SprF family membrane protein
MLSIFVCLLVGGHAQDPYLTLKTSMPLMFNPAFAGNEYYTRATLNYRNHYPASGTGFATYSASFDTYIDQYNSGLGLTLMSDQMGSKVYSYNSAGLFYSYKIQTGERNFFKTGLMANLYYGINNPDGLLFPDMINPDGSVDPNSFTYDRNSKMGVDFGFGGLFDSKFMETGVAVYHLGKEEKPLYWSRPVRVYAHLELKIPILDGPEYYPKTGIARYLQGSVLYPSLSANWQGSIMQWRIGAMYRFMNFNLGVYSRQNLNFSAFTNSFQIGYLSDIMDLYYVFDLGFTGKNYRGLATSSHEIGIVFKFATNKEERF